MRIASARREGFMLAQPDASSCGRMLLRVAWLRCSLAADDTPQALGTLEYDRITLPAPAAERIVAIDVA
jgi:HlyD family secretion protein